MNYPLSTQYLTKTHQKDKYSYKDNTYGNF